MIACNVCFCLKIFSFDIIFDNSTTIKSPALLFCSVCFFFVFFVVLLNLGFSGHATIALVLWIHCFHLHVLTSDVVSLLPFLDSISLIIIVVQCRV